MKWLSHLRTINRHRFLVMKFCFRLGLYGQGLTHDLSKYSYAEFSIGAKHYTPTLSPHTEERKEKGYSSAWLHHKGRNKHHMEYWVEFDGTDKPRTRAVEMPLKYVAEMFCDRVAACKVYQRERYTDASPYEYFAKSQQHYIIHPKTKELLERLLIMLRDEGEDATFRYIKRELLKKGTADKK